MGISCSILLILLEGSRIRKELHRHGKSESQTLLYVHSFILVSSITILYFVNLGRSNVKLEDSLITSAIEGARVNRTGHVDLETAGALLVLDVAGADDFQVLVHLVDSDKTSGVKAVILVEDNTSSFNAAIL